LKGRDGQSGRLCPVGERIDYILGHDVRFADSAVLEAGGSDHYPVAARILAAGKSLESKAYASAR
jgi:endonuclease/exonuclease/phosphatase family metal-dependent hydrolase